MAKEGGVDMLIPLLRSASEAVQRQAAKALANLGVNGLFMLTCTAGCLPLSCLCCCSGDNKAIIAAAGGIGPLIVLSRSGAPGVQVEAIAALANLAVNGAPSR